MSAEQPPAVEPAPGYCQHCKQYTIEEPLSAVAAVPDKGPWRAAHDKNETRRAFIESDDFTHDVRLYVNGDFATDEQRMDYARQIAQRLNAVPADVERDAARFRWGAKNARWIRHEHEAYVAIPVALDADLSCEAMRVRAIDAAMGESQQPPAPLRERDPDGDRWEDARDTRDGWTEAELQKLQKLQSKAIPPDVLAVLREARKAIDEKWRHYPVESECSVCDLFARIDAILAKHGGTNG